LAVVALPIHLAARCGGRAGRQHRLPDPRDHRLGVLGTVPVQPARARLEHPAAVPRPPPHPLPAPLHDPLQPLAMTTPLENRAGAGTQLALATLAFTACFYAWS